MREILFRGKRICENKNWVEGCLLNMDEDSGHVLIVPFFHGASTLPICRLVEYTSVYVNPETVGQFTGLTDQNGKKIFEGDIFSVTWSVKDRTPVVKTFVAVFKNGCFYARAFNGNQIVSTIANYANCRKVGDTGVFVEVIGNIYDNPELLEG